MKVLVLISISFILFSGCGFNKNQPAIPVWYINALQNDATYLYGVGEAYDLKDAKANALNDMASRLVVNVSSTLNKYTQTSQNNLKQISYTKDLSQDINLEVEQIKFVNVKLEKSQFTNGKFFILMKVDRQKLFKHYLKSFYTLDKTINNHLATINKSSKLEQIYKLKSLYPKVMKAKKLVYILHTINNNFDYGNYISKYNNSIDKIGILKSKLTINVTEDGEDLFKDVVIELLNQNSYKVSSVNSNVTIHLKKKIDSSTYKNWYIVKVAVNISIKSNDDINMFNKTLNIIGRSSSNKENALSNAKNDLKNQIAKAGIKLLSL
jgi:hypothetical protein